jgi:hypothetical protein
MSYICPYCHYCFLQNQHLSRHLREKRCAWLKIEDKIVSQNLSNISKKKIVLKKKSNSTESATNLEEKMKQLEEQLKRQNLRVEQLEEKPSVQKITNQNILQVVCIGSNDNYLDLLTERFGNFDLALEYLKGCALSNVNGDSQLIEKIYLSQLDPVNPSICFLNQSKTKIEYLNEKKEKVVDSKQSFSKKMANN